jgi:hypothetical protein
MFYIYKHNQHPEYRLIVPKQAELPTEIREEWTLCDMTDRVEAEQQAVRFGVSVCSFPLMERRD